jgi:hypothetical protein
MNEVEVEPASSRKGCLIILYAMAAAGLLVLVGGALFLLVAGVGMVSLGSSERGQEIVKGIVETTELALEATTAPGTDELRAAGCDQAMVTTVGGMMGAISTFVPEQDRDTIDIESHGDEVYVMCQISLFGTADLDCPGVARIYGAAVTEPPGRFVVMIDDQRDKERRCLGYYDAEGVYVGDVGAPDFRPVPPGEGITSP